MAQHKQAKKRIRQIVRRTKVNRNRISRIRSYIKSVETAIASGDRDTAQTALRAAQPEIMRGVTRGIIHRNQAARKISRLSAGIKAL